MLNNTLHVWNRYVSPKYFWVGKYVPLGQQYKSQLLGSSKLSIIIAVSMNMFESSVYV